MNILKKLRHPIIWIFELIVKITIKKSFFKNIANNDFKNYLKYTIELLPHETFFAIFNLVLRMLKPKSSDLLSERLFKEAIIHTIPESQRGDSLSKFKALFILILVGNLLKRSMFFIKNLIILPFKLGVYSYIASLLGFRPDYFLSFCEIFKFNLPSWTYQKLVELHISWMSWLKNTLQINSISIDSNSKLELPKIKKSLYKYRRVNRWSRNRTKTRYLFIFN